MDNGFWIALLFVSVGTLCMRLLPLLWMQRHLLKQKSKGGLAAIPDWLTVLGPLMIAAMLGVSLVPATPSLFTWLATILGAFSALMAWLWTKSLGWPVLAGVSTYGVVIVLARITIGG
ncbi:AzlD domain-containing protein [Alkalimonas collagenimarina]|uniref:AzlD domain-containing protein n=1 Tax=Alkalimonas collagenimarina TaxID=400390 RepID=A0ABT9GUS5_9GAMM|nr:AzlD domain-containing protein [Alkalimonas collagenimarina]MDP4534728.1 AzlD domain-containing protein [Alkalimonas collagenimarina]